MLEMILSKVGMDILDRILGKGLEAFKAYENKQISMEELKARMLADMLSSAKEIEIAHADTLAKTYESFMSALKTSHLLQIMWATTCVSMLFVLLWHMLAIPFIVFATGHEYPGSGSLVNWAYALLGGCLGLGPMVLRSGPSNVGEKLKSLIAK